MLYAHIGWPWMAAKCSGMSPLTSRTLKAPSCSLVISAGSMQLCLLLKRDANTGAGPHGLRIG